MLSGTSLWQRNERVDENSEVTLQNSSAFFEAVQHWDVRRPMRPPPPPNLRLTLLEIIPRDKSNRIFGKNAPKRQGFMTLEK
jgi:hypothetical protein